MLQDQLIYRNRMYLYSYFIKIGPVSPSRNYRANFNLILVGEHLIFGY